MHELLLTSQSLSLLHSVQKVALDRLVSQRVRVKKPRCARGLSAALLPGSASRNEVCQEDRVLIRVLVARERELHLVVHRSSDGC